MSIRYIGIKEFRQNMSKLAKEIKRKNIWLIVMNHSTPMWIVKPIHDETKMLKEIAQGQ